MECLTSKYAAMKLLSFYIHIKNIAYDDILTARIIEKVIVHSRQEIEIYFIGGYTQKIDLI